MLEGTYDYRGLATEGDLQIDGLNSLIIDLKQVLQSVEEWSSYKTHVCFCLFLVFTLLTFGRKI